MASLAQMLRRTFFWSYERGTWQYDLAVVVILIFVLLTPSRWFHDQPQVGSSVLSEQVQLVSISDNGHREIYKVDARIVPSPEQTPALQNELHNALQRAMPELNAGRFSIVKIEPLRDSQNAIFAYQVEIKR
jgi:hypothetical protein